MAKKTISDAPECETCDGHCCKSFTLYTPHNKKPWALYNFRKQLEYYYPSLIIKNLYITKDKKLRKASCSCSLFIDNRCSDYDNRPEFCKSYPYGAIGDNEGVFDGCPLAERLLREMENNVNE